MDNVTQLINKKRVFWGPLVVLVVCAVRGFHHNTVSRTIISPNSTTIQREHALLSDRDTIRKSKAYLLNRGVFHRQGNQRDADVPGVFSLLDTASKPTKDRDNETDNTTTSKEDNTNQKDNDKITVASPLSLTTAMPPAMVQPVQQFPINPSPVIPYPTAPTPPQAPSIVSAPIVIAIPGSTQPISLPTSGATPVILNQPPPVNVQVEGLPQQTTPPNGSASWPATPPFAAPIPLLQNPPMAASPSLTGPAVNPPTLPITGPQQNALVAAPPAPTMFVPAPPQNIPVTTGPNSTGIPMKQSIALIPSSTQFDKRHWTPLTKLLICSMIGVVAVAMLALALQRPRMQELESCVFHCSTCIAGAYNQLKYLIQLAIAKTKTCFQCDEKKSTTCRETERQQYGEATPNKSAEEALVPESSISAAYIIEAYTPETQSGSRLSSGARSPS